MGLFGIVIYIIFCFIAGAAASNRGRSGFGYFLLSLIISPIIVFIIIIVLGENKNTRRERIYEDAEIRENVANHYRNEKNTNYVLANKSSNFITNKDTKKCPFCAEEIKKEAIVCRFCGRDLPNENNKVLEVNILSENNQKDNSPIVKTTEIEKNTDSGNTYLKTDNKNKEIISKSIDVRKKKHIPENKKCKKCGQIVDTAIYVSCPNCECEEFIENDSNSKKDLQTNTENKEVKDIIIDTKWICGKCGNANDLFLLSCKKCNKER